MKKMNFPVPPKSVCAEKRHYEDARLRLMKGQEAYGWWQDCEHQGVEYIYEDHKAKHQQGFHFKNDDFEMDRAEALETEEEDGTWRPCSLYHMRDSEIVVLWFGKEEYEGLCGGYRIVNGKILDGDGDEIKYRRVDDFIPGSWVSGQCTMREAYGDGPLLSLGEQLEKDRIEEEEEVREMKAREKMAQMELWSMEHARLRKTIQKGGSVVRGAIVESLVPTGKGLRARLSEEAQAQAEAQALEAMTAKQEAEVLLKRLGVLHEAIVEHRLDGKDPDLSLRRQRDKEREREREKERLEGKESGPAQMAPNKKARKVGPGKEVKSEAKSESKAKSAKKKASSSWGPLSKRPK